MPIVVEMRAVLLGLVTVAGLVGEVDAREVVRRAAAANERNWRMARSYPAWERVNSRRLDSAGRMKSEQVKIFDVPLLEGSPYRRLAGRDDRLLPAFEAKQEQEMLERNIAERRKQTPIQRAERVLAYEQRPEWQRDLWRELPEAFDFRFLAEESLDGRRVFAIAATPHPGYRSRSDTAKLFPHLRGTLWISSQDYQLVKADAEVVDDLWMGVFLVRLSKGSRAILEQVRVDGDVWLPLRLNAFFTARVGLLKMLYIEHEVIYSRSYKFPTISGTASRVGRR